MNKQQSTADNFNRGVTFLMLGVTAGLALDIVAKKLLEEFSVAQFIFFRSVFGVLAFLIVAKWYGGIASLKTKRWKWHLFRSVLAIGAMFGFFFGLSRMPLVNTLTIVFVAPLIVTALSVPFLKEQVGWRRWIAVIYGFIGVIIVLRPSPNMFTLPAISLLLSACCWAGLAVTARKLSATESSFSLAFYVTAAPLFVSLFLLPNNFLIPNSMDWILFILAGIFSALAWIGIVGGYRLASPVVLAPFEYTGLVGAAIAGYLIWDEVPDKWVIIGGFIIISGGIYIVFREVGGTPFNRYIRGFSAAASATIQRRLKRIVKKHN